MNRFVPAPSGWRSSFALMRRSWPTHKWLYYRLGELGLDAYRRKAPPSETKQSRRISRSLIAAVVKTTGIVKIETLSR